MACVGSVHTATRCWLRNTRTHVCNRRAAGCTRGLGPCCTPLAYANQPAGNHTQHHETSPVNCGAIWRRAWLCILAGVTPRGVDRRPNATTATLCPTVAMRWNAPAWNCLPPLRRQQRMAYPTPPHVCFLHVFKGLSTGAPRGLLLIA